MSQDFLPFCHIFTYSLSHLWCARCRATRWNWEHIHPVCVCIRESGKGVSCGNRKFLHSNEHNKKWQATFAHCKANCDWTRPMQGAIKCSSLTGREMVQFPPHHPMLAMSISLVLNLTFRVLSPQQNVSYHELSVTFYWLWLGYISSIAIWKGTSLTPTWD